MRKSLSSLQVYSRALRVYVIGCKMLLFQGLPPTATLSKSYVRNQPYSICPQRGLLPVNVRYTLCSSTWCPLVRPCTAPPLDWQLPVELHEDVVLNEDVRVGVAAEALLVVLNPLEVPTCIEGKGSSPLAFSNRGHLKACSFFVSLKATTVRINPVGSSARQMRPRYSNSSLKAVRRAANSIATSTAGPPGKRMPPNRVSVTKRNGKRRRCKLRHRDGRLKPLSWLQPSRPSRATASRIARTRDRFSGLTKTVRARSRSGAPA